MPTLTKAASSNAVISGTAFTDPTNAYADDGNLATLTSSAKNQNPVGDHGWGFPGITTEEIPDGSTIDAVRCVGELGLTVAVTGGVMGLNGMADGSVDGGTEQTKTTAGLGILTYTYVTIPNLTDLRTANFYQSSVRYRRGNTTVSSTAQVDYLTLEIDWTAGSTPVTGDGAGTGAASTASGSAAETMSGTGAGSGAAATATGEGVETFTGTGSGTGVVSTASGAGEVESTGATGTGAGTGAAGTASGAGSETMTATAAGTQAAQTASGAGVETFAVTGAGTSAAATGEGSGAETFTGTGAGSGVGASAFGEGLQSVPVTGTGAGTQTAASASGEGGGGEVVAPSRAGGSYAPRPRPVQPVIRIPGRRGKGQATGARSTASGRGVVSDDDLVLQLVA
jgi:hypothetical protein